MQHISLGFEAALEDARKACADNERRHGGRVRTKVERYGRGHPLLGVSDDNKRALWEDACRGANGLHAWQSFALRVDVEMGVFLALYEMRDFPPGDAECARLWPGTPVPQARREGNTW